MCRKHIIWVEGVIKSKIFRPIRAHPGQNRPFYSVFYHHLIPNWMENQNLNSLIVNIFLHIKQYLLFSLIIDNIIYICRHL